MASRRLTIFLLKKSVARAADALRPFDPKAPQLIERPVVHNDAFDDATVFLREPLASEPEWADFVRPHVVDLPALTRRRASAVLLLKTWGRWFAIAFGQGRVLLDPDKVEPEFGLRVVINSVEAEALRSVDSRSLEELTLTSARRIGRQSSISVFGLDLERDLVSGLAGVPPDQSFAVRVAGSTALALHAELEFADIPAKCRQALSRFRDKTTYKDRFAWVDNFQRVSDRRDVDALEKEVDRLIASGTTSGFMLALPEVVADEAASRFRFSTARGDEDDLRWSDYVSAVGGGGISVASMKEQHTVIAIDVNGDETGRWSVYECLSVEIERPEGIAILTGGKWYRVARTLARRARSFVDGLALGAPALPPFAATDIDEGAYNERIANGLGANAVLLDKVPFTASLAQDRIEFADLLIAPNQIIHVKRHARSSTLSHLFQQGLNSAELLQGDDKFRNDVRARITAIAPTFPNPIPIGEPDPRDFEIVYGVVAAPGAGTRHFLPFFSQLSCERVARLLKARGFSVKLTRIDPA
jgi:uncharacterized protein (TIGR04141 family)